MTGVAEKKLKAIFPSHEWDEHSGDISVTDMTFDSRRVVKGGAFLAINEKAESYIGQAVALGACVIVRSGNETEKSNSVSHSWLNENKTILNVFVSNLKHEAGNIAAQFFDFPERDLCLVGVTGTNGKTSCVDMLRQCWLSMKLSVATIGTLGWRINDSEYKHTGMTMLDACENQRLLAHFVRSGVTHVAMEVSSHGIDQGRHLGLMFNTRVLTNISRDHLDYHGDMGTYSEIKRRFISDERSKIILNGDSDFIDENFCHHLALVNPGVYIYSMQKCHASTAVSLKSVVYRGEGVCVELSSAIGDICFSNTLVGAFNVSNCLAVVAVLISLGNAREDIEKALSALTAVEGRMQRVHSASSHVFIDYAHTPDALQKSLEAARLHCEKRLILVFGCGGDRDSGKRELMGKVAEDCADIVIITSDNPRTESPLKIIHDIRRGMSAKNDNIYQEEDRKRAIEMALCMGGDSDLILIAGKGHERYQDIQGKKIEFYDAGIVAEFYRAAS